MQRKPIAIGFDGVLNSCTSGWKDHAVISDQPHSGAIYWLSKLLTDERFDVCIHSVRCVKPEGIAAMMGWLVKHGLPRELLDKLSFADKRPPSHVLIDSRVMQFKGVWPSNAEIYTFVPWSAKTTPKRLPKKTDVDYSTTTSPEEAAQIWEGEHRCLSCLHGAICAIAVAIQSTESLTAVTKCTSYVESSVQL